MTIEDLQAICDQLPSVTQDMKWGDHLCFNVGGKMFLVTNPTQVPCTASFKIPDDLFEEIIALKGFSPQAYMARYKWVHVDDISRLNKAQWEKYITQSYALVVAKLPKKTRESLSLPSF